MPEAAPDNPSRLVKKFLRILDERAISWCQWKSTIDLDRTLSGASDLDLLVAREDQPALLEVLGQLGFREADPPPEKAAHGVRSFYGFDPGAPRLIHAHVHYQLMVGHDLSKGYRLPLEAEFLASAVREGDFRVPSRDLEFLAFVIRMILKRATLDSILRGRRRLSERDARELEWLAAESSPQGIRILLGSRLPGLDPAQLARFATALQPDSSARELWLCGRELRRSLAVRSPRQPLLDAVHRFQRGLRYRARRASLGRTPRYRPAAGGFIVAAVGSDGAGKSTALDAIEQWLSRDMGVERVHLGHPPWSMATVLVRGGLKLLRAGLRPVRRQSRLNEAAAVNDFPEPTIPELAKRILLARDRRLEYRKAARAAARGQIVLSDRFPLPGLVEMDGPDIQRLLEGRSLTSRTRSAIDLEERIYRTIERPDLLFVLQLPPELSLARKPEDNPDRVARGSRELLDFDWSLTNAIVLDASRPAADIAGELKRQIWHRI